MDDFYIFIWVSGYLGNHALRNNFSYRNTQKWNTRYTLFYYST